MKKRDTYKVDFDNDFGIYFLFLSKHMHCDLYRNRLGDTVRMKGLQCMFVLLKYGNLSLIGRETQC